MASGETGRYVTIAVEDWCEANITDAYHGIIVRYDQETGIAAKILDADSDTHDLHGNRSQRRRSVHCVSPHGASTTVRSVMTSCSMTRNPARRRELSVRSTLRLQGSSDKRERERPGLSIERSWSGRVGHKRRKRRVSVRPQHWDDLAPQRVVVRGQGNGASWGPSISADGRIVSFTSRASNLVPDDTNDVSDIYVRDRQTRGLRGNADVVEG